MMNRSIGHKCIAIGILSFLLAACGGGRSSSSSSASSTSSTSSTSASSTSSSSSSSSSGNIEPASLTKISSLSYEIEKAKGTTDFTWGSNIIVAGIANDQDVFFSADFAQTNLISDVKFVDIESGSAKSLEVTTLDLNQLEVGVHFGHITVNACKDIACNEHFSGSPQTIDISISIAPDKNPDETCEHVDGVLFVDCVDPIWLGISAWEQLFEGGNQYPYFNGDNDFLIHWTTVDTYEAGYNTVIDVQFADKPRNGSLRFQSVGSFQKPALTNDMSAFATGTIEFDVKVLDWGTNTNGLIAAVQCQWPCASKDFVLDGLELNRWKHFAFSVSDIEPFYAEHGFDLSKIDVGLLIAPTWEDMAGVHFQLDNVRWVKGEPKYTRPDTILNAPVSVSAAFTGNADAWSTKRTVTVENIDANAPVYFSASNNSGLSEVTFEETNSTQSVEVEINTSVSGNSGSTTKSKVVINACEDVNCHFHYPGSPHTIEVITTIAPTANLDTSCIHTEGAIFIDCVDPTWLGVAAFEYTNDNDFIHYHYFGDVAGSLIYWKMVDTNEAEHDTVLEVNFTDKKAVGSIRFPAVGVFEYPSQTVDMSEYSTGTIEFDVKVLDWGENLTGLRAAVECVWPCTSGAIPLERSNLNEWKHYSLSIQDIVTKEQDIMFDITNIYYPLGIEIPEGESSGVRFQLDNVRWIKGN